MKKVIIKQLRLRNFKKMKEFTLDPSPVSTTISGDNRTGKTTLATAFTWLLWGKDLQDRKDFEIKTLDENNNPIHKLEHEVSCILEVDGTEITMSRVYVEKWVKNRGAEFPELTGHETNFLWNDVPLKLSEFTKKVEEVFGTETAFKILTNPLYFNSLHWEKRREVLVSMIGGVSDTDIVYSNLKFQELMDKLSGKSMKEFEAQIKAQKKKIKDRMDVIPSLINENHISRPEEPDFAFVDAEIKRIEQDISHIESKIKDRSKITEDYFQRREVWLNSINNLKLDIRKEEEKAHELLQNEANKNSTKIYEAKRDIKDTEQNIMLKSKDMQMLDRRAESIIIEQDRLRSQFAEEQKKRLILPDDKFFCPIFKRTCRDNEYIHQFTDVAEANFNETVSKNLTEIRKKGQSLTSDIEQLKKDKEVIQNELKLLEEKLNHQKETLQQLDKSSTTMPIQSVESVLAENERYILLKQQKQQLEENPIQQPVDNNAFIIDELESGKKELIRALDWMKAKRNIKDQIIRLDARKEELESEERKLSQELSTHEKYEFLIEEFTRAKVDYIESEVNRLFPSVKFRMFEKQINGALKEVCDCLIDGVPFNAANSASQIQSGIEIINVLSSHYGYCLPIFVDNNESVTSLPKTSTQLIRLFVNENYKTLTVL